MTKFKKCPQCEGFIPETWAKHTKCGWNIEPEEKEANAAANPTNNKETAIRAMFEEKQVSISRAVALQNAVQLAVGKIVEKEQILDVADSMMLWLSGKYKKK